VLVSLWLAVQWQQGQYYIISLPGLQTDLDAAAAGVAAAVMDHHVYGNCEAVLVNMQCTVPHHPKDTVAHAM
jgi:hypothetical protein